MKILSFDVGIKNLAYCLGDIDEETKKLTIVEWDIINLLQEEFDNQNFCTHISKMKPYKKCSHPAIAKLPNNTKYYCKAHLKLYHRVYSHSMDKITCNSSCQHIGCSKKSRYVYNSLIKLCPSHKVKVDKEWKDEYKIKKVKKVSCKDFSVSAIADRIIKILDKDYAHFADVDVVLIELQPGFAKKMKTISNYLSMYLRVRGVNRIKVIKYYKATNKLKFDKSNTRADTKTYKNRKRTGIVNVNSYLDLVNDDYNKDKFNNHKKKDDLADSILQILSYIQINWGMIAS